MSRSVNHKLYYSRVWNKRTPLNKRSPLENLAKIIIVAPFLPYTMTSGIRPQPLEKSQIINNRRATFIPDSRVASESPAVSTSPKIDLFLTLGFHGACCIYAIMAFLCAFWGAATIPDNRGKSLVKVEEFYENKTSKTNKMNI